jgi:hypothetical protein
MPASTSIGQHRVSYVERRPALAHAVIGTWREPLLGPKSEPLAPLTIAPMTDWHQHMV